MIDFIKFKPLLCDLIRYYYNEIGHGAGGYLHIATDDGNLHEGNISFCQDLCKEHSDDFGFFIATLMRYFTEEELEKMYDSDWWGMEKK